MAKNEYVLFLNKFFRNPKQVGSILPSSRFLARKMVQFVPWNEVKAIAELGSGTGSVTRLIKSRVIGTTKVFLFEKDDLMKSNLQMKYPEFTSHSNACHLFNTIYQQGTSQLDCIISGLPFFNFSSDLRETLINQIIKALKPGGYFITFQYSLQMKKHFSERFFIEKIDFVPLNLPPAFVYICRKKGATG